jgi:hypothetical protein
LPDETEEELAKGINICSPLCTKEGLKETCPQDVPGGATGTPTCSLVDKVNKTKLHHCALECNTVEDCGAPSAAGHTAHCLPIPNIGGFCYYLKLAAVATYNFVGTAHFTVSHVY